MASIRKKGRGYEVRIKVHGITRSKSFATMQQARTWARNAEPGLLTTPSPAAAPSITLAAALKRYEAEVLPKLKGAPQECYRVAVLATTAMASAMTCRGVSYGVRLPSARRSTHDNRQIAGAMQDALDPHHSFDHTKEDHITIQSRRARAGSCGLLRKSQSIQPP